MKAERIHCCPIGLVRLFAGSMNAVSKVTKRLSRPRKAEDRHTNFPPGLLEILAEAPLDPLCLQPDPLDLIELDDRWPKRDRRGAAVGVAIGIAFDAASQGLPWLNRWNDGHPVGLWHWSRLVPDEILPLNGGMLGVRWCFAVVGDDGSFTSIRISEGQWVQSPPGYALSSPNCPWIFVERPWSPAAERKVWGCSSLDAYDLPRPRAPEPDGRSSLS